MISYLEGKVIETDERSAIIASDAIGWRVFFGPNTLAKLLEKRQGVKVFTHLHSRENTQELYGFLTFKGIKFFELLLSVSGVGPRHAQLILDSLSLELIAEAVRKDREEVFQKIPGIGTKLAQKIIIDIRSKIESLGLSGTVDLKALVEEEDVLEALLALGYKRHEAKEALKKIPEDIKDISRRIEEALKILGR